MTDDASEWVPPLDLVAIHGTADLTLEQCFPNTRAATQYIGDYCFNHNKKCVVKKGGRGKSNTYLCSDSNCSWKVIIVRRRVGAEPPHMYISTLNNEHYDIDDVADSLDGEWSQSFTYLPSLLEKICEVNPGSTVQVDVDQHERFLRGFVALGVNVDSQRGLIPLLGFDGTHCKHRKYNGVFLSLLGRDGNGQNVTLANALVNVENEDNILWFLRLCRDAGIDVSKGALFCDRGKIRGASVRLYSVDNCIVHLRYCSVHLLRNMKSEFSYGGRLFENAIWKIQDQATAGDYATALDAVRQKYGEKVVKFLADLHPIHWTVHGNMPGFDPPPPCDESVPTTPQPMFGWRTTNFVESDNSAMLGHGIRDLAPFDAFFKIVDVEMERLSLRDKRVKVWLSEGRVLTPHAKAEWLKETNQTGEYTVRRSTDTVFFVSRANTTKFQRVSLEPLSCSCSTFHQKQIPCRHIMPTLQHLKKASLHVRAFHPAYLVATYADVFKDKGIELPLRDMLKETDVVKPSPFYRQAGRRVTRRIASTGETNSSTYTVRCRACGETGHNRSTCRKHANDADEPNSMLVPTTVVRIVRSVSVTNGSNPTPMEAPAADSSRHTLAFLLD